MVRAQTEYQPVIIGRDEQMGRYHGICAGLVGALNSLSIVCHPFPSTFVIIWSFFLFFFFRISLDLVLPLPTFLHII